jgi:DNA-binding LacI/PurR family transcriptional regulator
VNIDDRGGAAAAARHLVGLGHRRIAIVTTGTSGEFGVLGDLRGAGTSHPERERLRGWSDVLSGAGIEPVVVRTEHGDPVASGAAAGELVFGRRVRPTGVLCFSDALAVGVMRAARDEGLDVPGDVSVVGFDDSPLARQVDPELSTVRQDVAVKGRAAVAALIGQIDAAAEGVPTPANQRVLLPTELIVRASTARPRSARRERRSV